MRKSNLKINFFAFQDIITSTTGILILITIILTLLINPGGAAPPPPDSEKIKEEIAQFKAEIDGLKNSISILKGMIAEWGSLDPEVISAEIEKLEGQLSAMEGKLDNLGEDEKELQILLMMLAQLEKEFKKLGAMHQAILAEIEKLKKTIGNIGKANTLFIIPEIGTGKKLIIIVVAKNDYELFEFIGGKQGKHNFNNRRNLLAHLKKKQNPRDFHIVFFVKPSGVDGFMALNGGVIEKGEPTPVKDIGFRDLGWEPIAEKFTLDFR